MPTPLPDRRRLRASDADRDATVEAIRRHGAVGRLGLEEITERIDRALDARTLGELDELVSDLPAESPPSPPVAAGRAPVWGSLSLWARAAELVVIDLVCVGVWALDGAHGFWPVWVVFLSLVVFARKVTKVAEREEHRRLRSPKGPRLPPGVGS